jgi:hypothetical protein
MHYYTLHIRCHGRHEYDPNGSVPLVAAVVTGESVGAMLGKRFINATSGDDAYEWGEPYVCPNPNHIHIGRAVHVNFLAHNDDDAAHISKAVATLLGEPYSTSLRADYELTNENWWIALTRREDYSEKIEL